MSLGPILVTGGCGFVGYHIVKQLLEDSAFSSVHVVSRNPKSNRLPRAIYHAADITNLVSLRDLLEHIKPRTIIHVASPGATDTHGDEKALYQAVVTGTKNLLSCAAAQQVQAFVYTSSVLVMAGRSFENCTEDYPLLTQSSRGSADPYSVTKAIADKAVLDANNPNGMRTVCLRPPGMYGERDNQAIPGALEVLRDGRHRMQVGDNTAVCDWCSVENCAIAHILAAKALLSRKPGVDGEAFFITDDAQIPFWDFMRLIWIAAGDFTPPSEITVLPAWFVIGLASITEWMYWIFSLGRKRPKFFRRMLMEHSCLPRSYSIVKARERLGFVPRNSMRENVEKGVAWSQKEYAEKVGGKKS
ncbi:MAG: hypothetical protein MMC33_007599 [Icmadophila ericetorum]|nr:hypothetical protein [Icmadophila ericetorum]